MAQEIPDGQSMLVVKREAYERAGITREAIDQRLGLTVDEFTVDGRLVLIGPVFDDAAFRDLLDELEGAGLVYFEEYFEFSGNWPSWIRVFIAGR